MLEVQRQTESVSFQSAAQRFSSTGVKSSCCAQRLNAFPFVQQLIIALNIRGTNCMGTRARVNYFDWLGYLLPNTTLSAASRQFSKRVRPRQHCSLHNPKDMPCEPASGRYAHRLCVLTQCVSPVETSNKTCSLSASTNSECSVVEHLFSTFIGYGIFRKSQIPIPRTQVATMIRIVEIEPDLT